MKALINVKNNIREFLRKYEEILFPILKFGWCYLVFHSVRTMFNYVEITSRETVLLLLAVLCAMLPDGFLMFFTGALIGVNCFSLTLEVGLSYLLLFLLSYCIYLRFFPKCSYVLFMVPLCYMIGMPFLAPMLAAIFVGIGGAVPCALGVVLYEFSIHTRTVANMLQMAAKKEEVETLQYYIDHILKNKELLMIMLVFMLTVVATSVLQKFSYPFARYAAIVGGGFLNVIFYLITAKVLELTPDMSSCMAGSLIGVLVGLVVTTAKGVLDFKHTQRVQFEDDEYYYYVKAVPKLDAPVKKKKASGKGAPAPERRAPLSPEERARRMAASQAGEEETRRVNGGEAPAARGEERNISRSENKEEILLPGQKAAPVRTEEERLRRPIRPEDGNEERPRRPIRPEEGAEGRPHRPIRPEEGAEGRPRRPIRPEDGAEGRPRRPIRPEEGPEGRPRRPIRPEDGAEGRPRRPIRPEEGAEGRPRRPIRPEDRRNGGEPAGDLTDSDAEKLVSRAKHPKEDLTDIEDEG